MNLRRSAHFERDYSKAPKHIQAAFDKQSLLLLQNLRHPSLRAKKYGESLGLWQARITGDWRFYFLIEGETYYLVRMRSHPKQ